MSWGIAIHVVYKGEEKAGGSNDKTEFTLVLE